MTKVSWKRILQRAGNDFSSPGHEIDERPREEVNARPRQATVRRPRAVSQAAEPPSLVAGELETELRRALQRQQGSSSRDQQEWDPIFMAQELRTEPLMPVPYDAYAAAAPQAKKRGATTRNILAVSLSAVVVGFAVQQIGNQWSDSENGGGGGGGGGNDGGQYERTEAASIAAPMKVKDQAKLVQTGYAIQPLISHPAPTELEATYAPPKLVAKEPEPAPQDTANDEAAAMFQRDMEEARKLFESKEEQAGRNAAPPVAAQVTPARAPVTTAAVTPAAVAPAARAPAPVAPVAVKPSATAKPQAEKAPSVSSGEENKLLARANDLMERGDITGARLLFEHLAFRGSALGAFALAQSYDAKHLEKLYVRGLAPDAKQADYWYRKAAELGGGQRAKNSR